MALKPVLESLDQVAEPIRKEYEVKDGKFILALDGAPPGFVPTADLATANGKVVEFRDRNVALLKELEELRPLKTKFEGIDPEAAKIALTKIAELEKKGVKGADDITAQIQAAVMAAVKPIQDQLTASNAATALERQRADESVLRSFITEKFLKTGGKPKAVDYMIGKAKAIFKVNGGRVEAQPNKFSTDHPGDPLTVDEWLVSIAKEDDFAFEPSKGGGAAPLSGQPNVRPGQTILKDPTPQQLGEYSKEIAQGKVRVEHSTH